MCSCQSLEQRGYSDVRTRNNKRLQASRNSLADLLEKRFLEGKKKKAHTTPGEFSASIPKPGRP